MKLDTIFTVKNEHLQRLNADEAVLFFAELLRAETRRLGLPITSVNISSRTNVPDGGVDATIDAGVPPESSLAQTGRTVFQIKAGDFKPWQPAVIRDELFGNANPASMDSLGAPVRACMDSGGRYALVCTGTDLTEPERSGAIGQLVAAFEGCGYVNPRVDVLSQNQLIALLQSLPSLSLALNGNGGGLFETYKRWADHDQMRMPFKPGKPQADLISGLGDELRQHAAAIHVHVRGEAGIGKTRLVLEALRPADLAPLVIYCEGPAKIRDSELLYTLLKDDNPFSLILVVDECDADTRSSLWDKLKHSGPRVKLVTIYSEFDDTTGNTTYMTAPPLANERIIEILQEYLPAAESANRWADFCSGSPRVAHVVGLNLKNNPDDLLKSPDTVNLWDRYICGGDKADSQQVGQRRVALRRLALFKRFGFGPAVIHEAKAIAALCAGDDATITWARFQEIIHELRGRKILQGDNTLYITPKLLHIKLWVDWWDIHGSTFLLGDLASAVPPQLLDWFFEMSKYAEESKTAQKVFKALLDENGPFQQSGLLKDPRGARFFLSLTEAAPSVALQSLNNTIGVWSREELLDFTTGRREVVWGLERIAVWRELFPGAARLLLRLAEAENEKHIGNNATGVFADLFSPGQGPVAPTEASPEERFPVLKEALQHDSKECRRIALLACSHALQTGHFSRLVGAEHQGLKRQPTLWVPKTWGELFNAYRRVWHLLKDRLDQMPDDERAQALDVMLNNSRGLTSMANLAPMVTETLTEFLSRPYVDKRKVIAVVEAVLHYDAEGYEPSVREAWEQLHKSLVTDDFHSLMQRYVAMDLLEDKFDEGQHTDKAQPKVEALADDAIANPDLLKPELAWLVTDDAKNGYNFGFSLGMRDRDFSLLPLLLDSQRHATTNANVFFFGGYLRALRERSVDAWEALMDALAADPMFRGYVPELTWRSGLTDRGAERVLGLAKAGAVPVASFRLFSHGGVIRQMSQDRFAEWIEFLLDEGSRDAASCAIALSHFYFRMGKSELHLPDELMFRALTAPALFVRGDDRRNAISEDYEWTELATAYINEHPERSIELASLMLEHFREEGTIVGAFRSQTNKVLDNILQRFPAELWPRIAGYLGPPIDSRAFHIYQWLREGALAFIPAALIWEWVERDIEKRAWYVAQFVPSVFPGDERSASSRQVLVRYGSRKDVRTNLMANFSTEMWWGPESSHAQQKLEQLRTWKQGETNANVLRWLNDYITSVELRVERAKVEEEREF